MKQNEFFIESKHISSEPAAISYQENSENEAVSALIALGYKPADAAKMVKSVIKPELNSEQLIREALKAAL